MRNFGAGKVRLRLPQEFFRCCIEYVFLPIGKLAAFFSYFHFFVRPTCWHVSLPIPGYRTASLWQSLKSLCNNPPRYSCSYRAYPGQRNRPCSGNWPGKEKGGGHLFSSSPARCGRASMPSLPPITKTRIRLYGRSKWCSRSIRAPNTRIYDLRY
jgi:hypothetical protein